MSLVVHLASFSLLKPSEGHRGFSNNDGDGNKNIKTAIGLLSKTTSLLVHHAVLYISLPLLLDYDIKMPHFTFYGGRTRVTMKFSFSF